MCVDSLLASESRCGKLTACLTSSSGQEVQQWVSQTLVPNQRQKLQQWVSQALVPNEYNALCVAATSDGNDKTVRDDDEAMNVTADPYHVDDGDDRSW